MNLRQRGAVSRPRRAESACAGSLQGRCGGTSSARSRGRAWTESNVWMGNIGNNLSAWPVWRRFNPFRGAPTVFRTDYLDQPGGYFRSFNRAKKKSLELVEAQEDPATVATACTD